MACLVDEKKVQKIFSLLINSLLKILKVSKLGHIFPNVPNFDTKIDFSGIG